MKVWLLAIRPKTLYSAVAPVLLGTAMALGDGIAHFQSAAIALLGALAIQIGTNLVNDYFDFTKGADTADRIGPVRVTQAGLLTPQAVQLASVVAFSIAAICCVLLVKRGGWPIAVIGISGILSGIFYTAGKYSLGYLGLGELFVIIFFGPVAVAGTYYVQSFEINPAVIIAGLAPGFFSASILVINNLRDIAADKNAGKKTMVVRFGRSFGLAEYLYLTFLGCLTPIAVYLVTQDHIYTLLAVMSCFLSIPIIKKVLTSQEGPILNKALANTGKLLMFYTIIFALGWLS